MRSLNKNQISLENRVKRERFFIEETLWSPFLQNTRKRRGKIPPDVSRDGCIRAAIVACLHRLWSVNPCKHPPTPAHPYPCRATQNLCQPHFCYFSLEHLRPILSLKEAGGELNRVCHTSSKKQQVGGKREEGLILNVSFFLLKKFHCSF